VRSTAAPYTESRLTRSVANERVGFPVVEQLILIPLTILIFSLLSGTSLLLKALYTGEKAPLPPA
jgi:hypothetical protein